VRPPITRVTRYRCSPKRRDRIRTKRVPACCSKRASSSLNLQVRPSKGARDFAVAGMRSSAAWASPASRRTDFCDRVGNRGSGVIGAQDVAAHDAWFTHAPVRSSFPRQPRLECSRRPQRRRDRDDARQPEKKMARLVTGTPGLAYADPGDLAVALHPGCLPHPGATERYTRSISPSCSCLCSRLAPAAARR